MLKLINAVQYSTKLKATIQSTGRLGFTKETADILELSTDKSIQFARDEAADNALYMVLYPSVKTEAFQVCKSGDYFYLATKLMFDDFGVDYKTLNVMYDLARAENLDMGDGGKVYAMSPRTTERKKADNQQDEVAE